MKFSVCIDALYRGVPSANSIRAVHEAGVSAIEFWSWSDKDIDAIRKVTDELGMTVTALLAKTNHLVDPSQRDAYLSGLKETIEVARTLGCKGILTTTGNDTGQPRLEQYKSVVQGLKAAAPLVEQAGMTLLLEPLNTKVDHAGYFLESSDEAFAIIDDVNHPSVKLLFDIYHQYITEDEVIGTIAGCISSIGHFHAAGYPGRHELHIGEMNYASIFNAIRSTGYEGYVGLEYFPVEDPMAGLKRVLS